MKPINSLPPFKRFCVTIGNLPSSYVDSMSYYECLMWLCKYLKDTVIPAINENAEAVNELINWFNNLDVQEEINNKLDEMAESGELENIIAAYLNTNALLGFNTVADMKLSENLVNGSFVKTLGYRSKNDGGGAVYKIRTITNEDVVNEMTILSLNDETLIAELIKEYPINPLQLGAYGDGEHDDLIYLQTAINLGNVLLRKGSYYVSDMINVPSNRIFDGGNNTLIPAATKYAIGFQDRTKESREIYIQNVLINTSTNPGSNGVYMESGYFIYIDNVNIIQLKGDNTIGFKQVNGFNNIIRNSRVYGDRTYTGQIGIEITTDSTLPGVGGTDNMTNNKYVDLLIQNLTYGIKANYSVTCNTVIFDNIGNSRCDYCYYIEGSADPLKISNARMELSDRCFCINGNININVDTFNAYNCEKVIDNNNTLWFILNGSYSLTGTSQSTKYKFIYATNNLILSNAIQHMLSSTYDFLRADGITGSGIFKTNIKGVESNNTSNSLNLSPSDIRTYKTSVDITNIYGIKGSECYIYTDAADDTYQISSYGTTSAIVGNIQLKKNRLYHILMIENNKFTIID